MITRQKVGEMVLQYLNGEITLVELTEWAETYTEPEDFDPDENAQELIELMEYIASKDVLYAPFSQHEILSVLQQTGTSIKGIEDSQ